MSKKFTLAAALALLSLSTAMGRTLTPDEARANASAFLSSGIKHAPALTQGAGLKLAGTLNTASAEPALYLFTGQGAQGLVVCSAESETAEQVLGYSDSGTFDFNNINPNLRYWLSCYQKQIEALRSGQAQAAPAISPRMASYASISPITETQWDQDAPYNNLCPTHSGTRCYTGCVATATAQAMKVFEYPPQGKGTVTYTWNYGGYSWNSQTLTQNLAHSLDWANMQPTYSSSASGTAATAVATLMRDVGYACHMSYGDDYTGGSGAMEWDAARALVQNFDYDKGLYVAEKASFNDDYWKQLIYGELQRGVAVIYCGSGDEGGHCFICDGYQSSTGKFHFNWGWSGSGDGYYSMTNLVVNTSGQAGGAGYSFSEGQSAIIGMKKPVSGSQYSYQMYNYESKWGVSPTSSTPTATFTFSGQFVNMSTVAISGKFGVKCVSSTGDVTYAAGSTFSNFDSDGSYKASYTVSGSNMPTAAGTYTVTPAFYVNDTGQWYDMQTSKDYTAAYTMTVTSSKRSFSATSWDGFDEPAQPQATGEVTVSALAMTDGTELYTDGYGTSKFGTATLDFTISDTESETVTVTPVYYTASGSEMARANGASLSLTAGQTKNVQAQQFTLSTGTLVAGAAQVGLLVNGEANGPKADITILNGKPFFTFADNATSYDATANTLTITAQATCERAMGPNPYSGKLFAYAYPNQAGQTPNMGKVSIDVTDWQKDETRPVTFTVTLTKTLAENTTYSYKFGMLPTGGTASDYPLATVYTFTTTAAPEPEPDPEATLTLSDLTATSLYSPSYKSTFPVGLSMTLTSDQAATASVVPVFYNADGTEIARGEAQSATLEAKANTVAYSQAIASGTLVAGEAKLAIEVDGTELGDRADVTVTDGKPYFTFHPQVELTDAGFTVSGTAQCVRSIGPDAYTGKFHVYVYDEAGKECTSNDYVADAAVPVSDIAAGTQTTFSIPVEWNADYTPVASETYYYVIWINEGTSINPADPTVFSFAYEPGETPEPQPDPDDTVFSISELNATSLYTPSYKQTFPVEMTLTLSSTADATASIVPVFYDADGAEMARGTAQEAALTADTPAEVAYSQLIATGELAAGDASLAIEVNGTETGDRQDVVITAGTPYFAFNPGFGYDSAKKLTILSHLDCLRATGPQDYTGSIYVYVYEDEACTSGSSKIKSTYKSLSGLAAGAGTELEFNPSWKSGYTPIANHTYYVKFGFTENGGTIHMLADKYTFTASVNPSFSYVPVADVEHATHTSIDINVDATLVQGIAGTEYDGHLYMRIYPTADCTSGTSLGNKVFSVPVEGLTAGETGHYTFHIAFDDETATAATSPMTDKRVTLSEDTQYWYQFRVNHTAGGTTHYLDGDTYTFTMPAIITGVDTIQAAETEDDAEYYTLQGFRIEREAMAPGTVYIRRTAAGATKVVR